jgi:hypothetical protein
MNDANVLALLRRHLPPNAVDYCFNLWERNNFVFRVKHPRRSKLGDYRYIPGSGIHYITVNNDLNRYAFLITYFPGEFITQHFPLYNQSCSFFLQRPRFDECTAGF